MTLFDVYPLSPVTPVSALDCSVWDNRGVEYLDLYGGHAVISVGHTHPHYVKRIQEQLGRIGFYSNSVRNPLQEELAQMLGKLSGLESYALFLCNSGAEANENALKLASFHTGRKKVVAFQKGFHGRTSAAVAATDNPKIVSPLNAVHEVQILPWNDLQASEEALSAGDVAAVIVEGIQGVGGIRVPDPDFLEGLERLCHQFGTVLILDEIQSGYGRSGKFFAFQHTAVQPHLVTMAKGMGNGFPVGGVLIAPGFSASHGLLGTTFGGNYLAVAASLAVLEIMAGEQLIDRARETGNYLLQNLSMLPGLKEARGAGLMIGLEFERPVQPIRAALLEEKKVFTGVSGAHTIRLLPPLTLQKHHCDRFLNDINHVLRTV